MSEVTRIRESQPLSPPISDSALPTVVREVQPAGSSSIVPAELTPILEGLQAGSWAIVLVMILAAYTFKGKVEKTFDALVTALEGVKNNSDNSERNQLIIIARISQMESEKEQEINTLRRLIKIVESLRVAVDKLGKP